MHDVSNGAYWVQLAGALFVVALGAFVASLRPRTRPNLAFAVFAIAFGGQFALTNLGYLVLDKSPSDADSVFEALRLLLRWAAVMALAAVALVFPTQLRRDERRLLAFPAGLTALFLLASAWVAGSVTSTTLGAASLLGFLATLAVLAGLHALFALRFAAAPDPRSAQLLGYVAGALALYSAFVATSGPESTRANSLLSPDPLAQAYYGLLSACILLGAFLWIWATVRGQAPQTARNVALLTFGVMLAGLAYVASGLDVGALGVVRILAVAVLAYAILKHQLLGIDVKVRWTISKSTVAAIFITVFFLTSEAAQVVFATEDNEYFGIAAAGLLVFALAPLMQFAERVANAAVPVAGSDALPRAAAEPEEMYRGAVRLALRDHLLTREEERALFRLARGLSLSPDRAHEILVEVEREAARGHVRGTGR
ncbi:MAG TPA: hypothetical protein VM681_08800 [Candidatus Thermoplasmatota archaeon]|nr:hypothetical protein [Candidatus Thermoplasmatota archaeon]